MSDNEIINRHLALRSKNLAFFQKTYPGIFSYFCAYQLKTSKLDIQPQKNEVDLIENGRHLYQGARQYSPREVKVFLETFDYGKYLSSVKPLYSGAYKNPRFFARHIDRIYRRSPLLPDAYKGYQIPDFFPLTVFMGVGLGLHIESLIVQRQLQHVIVAETNMDHFMASLYVVDWESLVLPYLEDEQKSFRFVLIPGDENEQQIRDVIWNHLIEYCPFFPVMTFFYNHLGAAHFGRVIDSINADLYVHLFSFGNYDDEINQLNNAVHNFKQEIGRLPLPRKGGFDLPVCIVGSGPSLDERIECLKSIQNKAVIVSCGTALRALYKHGIKPDFQIELESDFNSFTTQSLNEDKDFLRSVKLVGAAQLTPRMFTLFDEKRMFFKGDGVLKDLLALDGEAINDATPTCTNAGLAFAFHYGFKKILLFGLDYGFPDKDRHHAAGALYYKDDAPEGLKNASMVSDNTMIRVPSASGGTILTSNFLFSSKRRAENIIQAHNKGQVFNCSNGSHIEQAAWLKELDSGFVQTSKLDKQEVVEYLFSADTLQVSQETVEAAIAKLGSGLKTLIKFLQNELATQISSDQDLVSRCYRINHHLQTRIKPDDEALYYFIRGSLWHFLHAGFSHAFALDKEAGRQAFIASWQGIFREFIDALGPHFDSLMHKDFDLETDLLTRRSICQTESDLPYAYLDDLDWSFTGVILQDNGQYILLD